MEYDILERTSEGIAVLGHIIENSELFNDVIKEIFGKVDHAELKERLKHFDDKVNGFPGIR